MKRALLVVKLLLLLCGWMTVTTNAYTAPPRTPPLTKSPINEPDGSIVPGAPPSREHRWGTVMIYGRRVLDPVTLDQAIVGVEWDLFGKRVVRRVEIDRMPFQGGTVQTARIEDNTFVVFGTMCGGDQPAMLYALDSDGRVLERVSIGSGCGPAIVANESFVVVGLYEDNPPVLPADPATGWQPREAYHVRVFDRVTRRLVGARVFRGDVLFAPKPLLTSQVLAMQGARVFVSLPMIEKARIIGARLPSLVTEAEIDLAVPQDPEASASIAPFKGGIVALADGWVELSADLVIRKRREVGQPRPLLLAVEPQSERVFADEGRPRGSNARDAGPDLRAQSLTWAWGHPVALGVALCTGTCPSTYGAPSLLVLP